jgi:hypothetical protein
VALVAATLVLAGCAQVPRGGPVVEVKERTEPLTGQAQYSHPKGPQPGDTRHDIVTGFLVAMTATPLEISTAREFLSTQAQQQWKPQRVVTYRDHTQPHGTDHVAVRLRGADQVGEDGQWEGLLSPAARRVTFPLTREDGQWRISQVPDALIVPRTFYDQQYQEAEIYFFDPSGRILVPEPVHVPQGSLASALVRALVRGPSRSLTGVVHSFLPPALSAEPVPVSNDGVADVTLTLNGQAPGPMSRSTTELVLDQLSWTLRQDASITGFRLSIAGHQVTDPTGTTGSTIFRFDTDETDSHDPAVSKASSQYYALRSGRLVSGQLTHPTSVDGPFGEQRVGIGAFAISLNGEEAAGVTSEGLLVGQVSQPGPAVRVVSGSDLLRPAWDFSHRLWEIQDSSRGGIVSYVRRGRDHVVRVPGITGHDVTRFLVSRDGSRLVAVLHGPSTDRIMVSRIRYDADDRPQRGTPARRIPWESSGAVRIRDIGWSSPTTLEVLDQLSARQSETRILNVDGSTEADEAPTTTIPGPAVGLVTSPVGGPQTPYAVLARTRSARRSLYDLAQVDTTPPSVASISIPALRHITYAG